jgi:hypothetical protein
MVAVVGDVLLDAGLLLTAELFAPLDVLAGLLVCAEQRAAIPRDNAAIAATFNLFMILSVCFFV